MAHIEYTEAQRQAVFYPDGNLLLSAAAGSGKTAALTGRIVQLVIEGRAELSQMLIVTFTKSAAGEMKARIGKRLREEFDEYRNNDQQIMSRLTKAMSQLPSADISTIHSFLYKSLKPYFPTMSLSQETGIVDEKEINPIKEELMRDIVDEFFEKDEKTTTNSGEGQKINFVELADVIGQARDTTAVDTELLWLYKQLGSVGKDVRFLDVCADELEEITERKIGLLQTKFGEMVISNIQEFREHYLSVFDELAYEFENEPKTNEKYGAGLSYILNWLREMGTKLNSENEDLEELRAHFLAYKPERLGSLSAKDATETSENFKNYKDEIKKEITKITLNYFSAGEAEFIKSASKTAGILRTIAVVLHEFERRLQEKKQSLSILEYNDLESLAIGLFKGENDQPTAAAKEIGSRYKYIFVDEYQDTNRTQDEIFKMIGHDSVRFMVGDIKQSIYRFRGGDPRVFSEYRAIWKKAETNNYADNTEYTGNSIFMSENFRCSSEIISFINAVSNYILPHGGIPYEAEDALVYGQKDEKPRVPVEVVLIEKKRKGTDDEDEEESAANSDDAEARYAAKRIAAMIGRYSEDGSKIISPSDIAILLRSPSSSGGKYRKALAEFGISTEMKTEKALGEYRSIMLLICLLKFIDNPLRDIYAAGALKSPLFGFTVDDIISLRNIAGDLPLYTAVLDMAEDDNLIDSELSEKCKKLTSFTAEEKLMHSGISIEKYLENLLEKTGFLRIKEIRESPAETDAIRKVLEIAKDFENKNRSVSGGKTLHGFIEHLDDIAGEPLDGGENQNSNSVSIMSIHASKGLEFPVCLLCETAKRRNRTDESRTILFDDELGFGMQLPDSTGLVKCDNLIRRAISHKMAVDSVQEEMRMLYVALTRAKGKLIVTAKTNDAEKMLARAQLDAEFADGYVVKNTDSYIEWILGGVIKNQHSDKWKIYTVSENDIAENDSIMETTDSEELDKAEIERKVDTIRARFDFEYPYGFLEKIPSKLVVSRLQPEILDEDGAAEEKIVQYNVSDLDSENQDQEQSHAMPHEMPHKMPQELTQQQLKRPKFMIGKNSAAPNEIGSATHRFLQFVDFEKLNKEGFESERARLIEKKFISQSDADIINIQQIRRFMQSSLFDLLCRSDFVKREFRFNVLVDAEEFTEDVQLKEKLHEENVKITVQGVVDCVFRHPDSQKLILVDYKTDSIHADEWKNQKAAEERLRERHKNQLTYYKRICSEMFEEEIAQTYIYSTVLGRCIEI